MQRRPEFVKSLKIGTANIKKAYMDVDASLKLQQQQIRVLPAAQAAATTKEEAQVQLGPEEKVQCMVWTFVLIYMFACALYGFAAILWAGGQAEATGGAAMLNSSLHTFVDPARLINLTVEAITDDRKNSTMSECIRQEYRSWYEKERFCQRAAMRNEICTFREEDLNMKKFNDGRCDGQQMYRILGEHLKSYTKRMWHMVFRKPFSSIGSFIFHALLVFVHVYIHRGKPFLMVFMAFFYSCFVFANGKNKWMRTTSLLFDVFGMLQMQSLWPNQLQTMYLLDHFCVVLLVFKVSCILDYQINYDGNPSAEPASGAGSNHTVLQRMTASFWASWKQLGSVQIMFWWILRFFFCRDMVEQLHLVTDSIDDHTLSWMFFAIRTAVTAPWDYMQHMLRARTTLAISLVTVELGLYLLWQYLIVYSMENTFFNLQIICSSSHFLENKLKSWAKVP